MDEFYPFSSLKSLSGGVKPPGKLFFRKLNVCIAKDKEKHS